MFDNHSLFGYSHITDVGDINNETIILTIEDDDIDRFLVDQQVVICPNKQVPVFSNSMIARITNIAGNQVTIDFSNANREGSDVITIKKGYQIANVVTPKVLTDIEDNIVNIGADVNNKVDKTTTVNGQPLSSDVTVTASDIGLGNVTNDAQLKLSDKDVDGTLATNSDTKIPSQKAVKTYVDNNSSGQFGVNVKNYGAIGDGNRHPLSEFYPDLAAAKVKYPFVTSLNDTIDWAAFTLTIESMQTPASTTGVAKGRKVLIPFGKYIFSRAWDINRTVVVEGEGANLQGGAEGRGGTTLLFDDGVNGINVHIPGSNSKIVTGCSTTSGSPTITGPFSATSIIKGGPVTGPGIPANSYVGKINSTTSINLSSSQTPDSNGLPAVNATATATGVDLVIPDNNSGERSVLRNFSVWAAGKTIPNHWGVRIYSQSVTLDHVRVKGFSDNGYHVQASVNDVPRGNANLFTIINGSSNENGGHGLYVKGNDANAGKVVGLSVNTNGKSGFYDNSSLGNSYIGCHAAGNGQDRTIFSTLATALDITTDEVELVDASGFDPEGGVAQVVDGNDDTLEYIFYDSVDGNTLVDCKRGIVGGVVPTVTQPIGTKVVKRHPGYWTSGTVNRSVFTGCYSEGGVPDFIRSFATIQGGTMRGGAGALFAHDLKIEPSVEVPLGIYSEDYSGSITLGDAAGSMRAFRFTLDDVEGTYTLTWKSQSNSHAWQMKLGSSLTAYELTTLTDPRGAGYMAFPQGLLLGPASGSTHIKVLCTSTNAPPSTGSYPKGSIAMNGTANVGDVVAWKCTVAGDYAGTPPTWVAMGKVGDDLSAHLADTSDAHDASAISLSAVSGMSSTDVQAAVAELASSISGGGTPAFYQVFDTPGTYSLSKLAGKTTCILDILGGGSGGGSGAVSASGSNSYGGASGGSAGHTRITISTDDMPATVGVKVGLGGAGGLSRTTDSTDGDNGTAGGISYVGDTGATAIAAASGGTSGAGGGRATTSPSAGGGGTGSDAGAAGATAVSAGGPGNSGNSASLTASGGAGGGITTAGVRNVGGDGNRPNSRAGITKPTGGAVDSHGTSGTDDFPNSAIGGTGGGGGGAQSASCSGGNGGVGGPGSGGAGGGAAINGSRVVADGVTTNGSPIVTGTFTAMAVDVGCPISGTGIPASSYIGLVNSSSSISLSSSATSHVPVNATADGTGISVTVKYKSGAGAKGGDGRVIAFFF